MDNSAWGKVIAGALIALLGSLLVAKLREWFGTDIMLLSVFIPICAFGMFFGYLAHNKMEGILGHHNSMIEKFEGLISYAKSRLNHNEKLHWIVPEEHLLEVEKNKQKSKNIWIINPDPSDDTGHSQWVPVIQNNIKDGSIYTYISPKRDTLGGAIKGLKSVFRNNLGQCKIVEFSEDEFKRLPFEHLVVYDPDNHSDETECFAEILGEERGYWFKVPLNKRNEIIGTLSGIVSSAKPLSDL
jgi:hypothetical protein